MYHIVMRSGTTEYAIHVMFSPGMQAYVPLGTKEKLASPTFPVSISFIYGDEDWVVHVDDDAAQKCIIQNQKTHGKEKSLRHECMNAGHNMHMDNP